MPHLKIFNTLYHIDEIRVVHPPTKETSKRYASNFKVDFEFKTLDYLTGKPLTRSYRFENKAEADTFFDKLVKDLGATDV
jgi:hypothetical protein